MGPEPGVLTGVVQRNWVLWRRDKTLLITLNTFKSVAKIKEYS